MKYIAFSLWGNAPKYCVGAIKNAKLYPTVLPGWTPIFWHDDTVPPPTVAELVKAGAHVRNATPFKWCPPCMWRFLTNEMTDCEMFISRDCDSRPLDRDAWAVRAWERSPAPFHVIRDHPNHGLWPVLAGMFGSKRGFISDMEGLIRSYRTPHTGYGHDQNFLRDVIWPKAQNVAMQHDGGCRVKFKGAIPMPPRINHHFVGARYDENDAINQNDLAEFGK